MREPRAVRMEHGRTLIVKSPNGKPLVEITYDGQLYLPPKTYYITLDRQPGCKLEMKK